MRALIIDDSRAMRLILGKMLREVGFEVLEAGHGAEGLQRLQEAGADLPALALVDWNMPEMNGYQFVQAVRNNPAWNSVVLMMVTTETEMEQVTLALAAGANEYVMKPFTREVIVDKLALLGLAPCVS